MKSYIVVNLFTGKAVKTFINDKEKALEYVNARILDVWYIVELEITDYHSVKKLDGCIY